MQINVKDEDYSENNEWYKDDDDVIDGRGKRFTCDFEGCKKSYKWKAHFADHFASHFTDDSTCKR